MITMLPQPGWLDLARALAAKPPDLDVLAGPWCGTKGTGYWLSRSAWSLRVIAEWRKSLHPASPPCVWVPDLFCDQSLGGLREAGVTLVFYPVTATLAPDWEPCRDLARAHRPDIFVLVHYFGVEGPVVVAAEFACRHEAILVEDCAHCLLPQGAVGRTGDFALFSPHKLLALPDGAVLVALPGAARFVGGDEVRLKESLTTTIAALPAGQNGAGKWVVRRILARLLSGVLSRFRQKRDLRPLEGEGRVGLPWPARPAGLSLRLLAGNLPRLRATSGVRLQNAVQFKGALEGSHERPAAIISPSPGAGTPFLLGLEFPSGVAARVRGHLAGSRLPASCWPDIPPEVRLAPDRHAAALHLWRSMIFLPVHQDLSVPRWLKRAGWRPAPLPPPPAIAVDWSPEPREWEAFFQAAPRSSLLQSGYYARAKQRTGSWRARFGLVRSSGRVVATVAALTRAGLTRINRGPTWVDETIAGATQQAAFHAIAGKARWWQGRILLMAPNTTLSDAALAALFAAGLRRRRTGWWHSAWIDLRRSPAELQAALDGKWRNQLNVARRSGLPVEIVRSAEAVDWIVDRHEEMKTQRGIDGPAADLLRALREEATGSGEGLVVLRAGPPGEPLAGILIARHGTSCTYLIGWNSDEGRRRNAGNLLLWTAMEEMSRVGCQWLDLCGIDDQQTRGIAAFKRGMGGVEYQLAGEYWAA